MCCNLAFDDIVALGATCVSLRRATTDDALWRRVLVRDYCFRSAIRPQPAISLTRLPAPYGIPVEGDSESDLRRRVFVSHARQRVWLAEQVVRAVAKRRRDYDDAHLQMPSIIRLYAV